MPFGSYLINSTANPAHFHSNWAGLALLFRIVFKTTYLINPQTTIALTFLNHNIAGIGVVHLMKFLSFAKVNIVVIIVSA